MPPFGHLDGEARHLHKRAEAADNQCGADEVLLKALILLVLQCIHLLHQPRTLCKRAGALQQS